MTKRNQRAKPDKKAKKRLKYALSKTHTNNHVRPFFDMDYLHKLNDDERAWMSHFCQEYYKHTYANDGFDLHPPRSDSRKRCFDADNARRRDIWNKRDRDPDNLDTVESEEDECEPQ